MFQHASQGAIWEGQYIRGGSQFLIILDSSCGKLSKEWGKKLCRSTFKHVWITFTIGFTFIASIFAWNRPFKHCIGVLFLWKEEPIVLIRDLKLSVLLCTQASLYNKSCRSWRILAIWTTYICWMGFLCKKSKNFLKPLTQRCEKPFEI